MNEREEKPFASRTNILLKGVNDSIEDAKKLSEFTKISPCKINLIEYNSVENIDYQKSTNKSTTLFISYLEGKNIITNLRKSKGSDVNAACGQLISKIK